MKGSCLCGAIEVSTANQSAVEVCHCNMCRRWGGGPLLAVHCGQEVSFSGDIRPATFRSSDWAERGFCSNCGTHLFYRLLPTDEYVLPAGLFHNDEKFQMASQIFIDQKPNFYEFANETPMMTGEQAFAQYTNADN